VFGSLTEVGSQVLVAEQLVDLFEGVPDLLQPPLCLISHLSSSCRVRFRYPTSG
jgi:hypothetical protein